MALHASSDVSVFLNLSGAIRIFNVGFEFQVANLKFIQNSNPGLKRL